MPHAPAVLTHTLARDRPHRLCTTPIFQPDALCARPPGVLVNGKSVSTINSKPLCNALLNCYFDGKSVSPGLKSTCAEGLLELL